MKSACKTTHFLEYRLNYFDFSWSELKSKGSKSILFSNTIIFPVSPFNITLIGSFDRFSYSAITCLHDPQGDTGKSTKKFSDLAVTAIALNGIPGNCDEAANIATLSAHKPEG